MLWLGVLFLARLTQQLGESTDGALLVDGIMAHNHD